MTSSIVVLAVLTVSFILFVTGWMKPDLIAMLVLVVDSLLKESTGEGSTFFEFRMVGVVLLVVAIAYIFTVGQRLLPGEGRLRIPSMCRRP